MYLSTTLLLNVFFCLGVSEPEPGAVDSIILGVGTIVWRPYVDP